MILSSDATNKGGFLPKEGNDKTNILKSVKNGDIKTKSYIKGKKAITSSICSCNIYIYIYWHTHTHTYIYMPVHICVCACVHSF